MKQVLRGVRQLCELWAVRLTSEDCLGAILILRCLHDRLRPVDHVLGVLGHGAYSLQEQLLEVGLVGVRAA